MSNERLVYLDNNATTRVAPEVVEAMLPCLTEHWGNPSSAYDLANAPSRMIAEAREKVAKLIGADPRNIVFTSCGTESNNAAIQSALHCNPTKRHVITSVVEHTANIKFCGQLEKRGYEATFLPVDLDGGIDLCDLQDAIRPDTAIVSLMWANNETGVLFPVEELAAICRSRGVLFHTDAIQVAGKLPIDVQSLGVDFLSLSAHKLRAPKGIGLLYIKPGAPFEPYIIGGGQERGQRGGTENVAYIVAFGKAAELALDLVEVVGTHLDDGWHQRDRPHPGDQCHEVERRRRHRPERRRQAEDGGGPVQDHPPHRVGVVVLQVRGGAEEQHQEDREDTHRLSLPRVSSSLVLELTDPSDHSRTSRKDPSDLAQVM